MSFESTWSVSLPDAVENLDAELRVVEGGKVSCCIGMMCTLYVLAPSAKHTRAAIIEAYERYLAALSPGDLFWGADPKSGLPRKLAGTMIGDVRSWAPRIPSHLEFSFAYKGGAGKDDADPYGIDCLLPADRPDDVGYLSFSLPLSWLAKHPPRAFLDLVLDACRLLKPIHGYAGLGVIPHINESAQSPAMRSVVALAARFRGLELDFPWSHADKLAEHAAIKGVNWLTVLEDSWVQQLGGTKGLRASLSSQIGIHDYPGGVVLRAGSQPRFGDVNRSEPMPEYEEVAKVLKPIRATTIGSISTIFGFDEERTSKWLLRFDSP